MVIHIKFEKKNNINITNEDILKNMSYIDDLLKKDSEIYDIINYSVLKYQNKNNHYFIILCIIIIIIAILIYYIKYFLYK